MKRAGRIGGRPGARVGAMAGICAVLLAGWCAGAHGETLPARGARDARVRSAEFDANEVYRLYGFVGYQIDIEFEEGETFLGLGAGEVGGVGGAGDEKGGGEDDN